MFYFLRARATTITWEMRTWNFSGQFTQNSWLLEFLLSFYSSIDFPIILPVLSLLSLLFNSLQFDNHSKLVNGECCRFPPI